MENLGTFKPVVKVDKIQIFRVMPDEPAYKQLLDIYERSKKEFSVLPGEAKPITYEGNRDQIHQIHDILTTAGQTIDDLFVVDYSPDDPLKERGGSKGPNHVSFHTPKAGVELQKQEDGSFMIYLIAGEKIDAVSSYQYQYDEFGKMKMLTYAVPARCKDTAEQDEEELNEVQNGIQFV
jgi:hypothetical protein